MRKEKEMTLSMNRNGEEVREKNGKGNTGKFF